MELEQILKKLGYTDEQIKGILDAMAAGKLHVSSVEKPEETIRQLQEDKKKLEQEKAALQKAADSQAESKPEETAAEIRRLQETVQKAQINLQLVKALTKANAADVDYMIYQAEKSGGMKSIKFNEDGSVSGVEELVEGLKKDYASQFVPPKASSQEMVRTGIKKLETTETTDDIPQTLEEAIAQRLSEAESK